MASSDGDDRGYVEAIARLEDEHSQWYIDIVRKAELADYSPVRGCMVIRPYGYALWERIQADLDRRFKEVGVENAYFPLFIPESIFQKEVDHVEGFSPEVPWVTQVGEGELSERLAIRPTSEMIVGTMYSRWIESYRDLPVLINQWCNVVRWEQRTLPFLRTTEFLWQEGHTAHRNEAEAREWTLLIHDLYQTFLEEHLAIPVLVGQKTEREKFAGAVDTFTLEALMNDGRALQAGTSHYLGDGFAQVLDIRFQDRDGQHKFVHQTSWGVTTRLIGALIMVHGDDRGLVLPPRVAPHQAVIVPITPGDSQEEVLSEAERLRQEVAAAGIRVHLDDRLEHNPGWKFNEWELRGVPIRLELGPRDMANDKVVVVRRDTGEKENVSRATVAETVAQRLDEQQASLLEKARAFAEEHTQTVDDLAGLTRVASERAGFAIAGWCGRGSCEEAIKDETGATIRCIPFEGSEPAAGASCIHCGEPASHRVPFARAY